MPEEWPHVYEYAARFEAVADSFEIADDIRSCVKEEDSGYCVEGFSTFFVAI